MTQTGGYHMAYEGQIPAQGMTEDEVRAELRKLITEGVTQAEIARGAGVSDTSVSQFLNRSDKYKASFASLASKFERFLAARCERRELLTMLPIAPEWFVTPTSQRILSTLSYAQIAGDIALIIGGAGQSKTTCCRQYAGERPNVWHVEMTRSHGRHLAALERVARKVGVREPTRAPAALQDAIEDKLRGTQGLLIIDEAQHLETSALEALRAIPENAHVGLALVGNESVYARLTGGTRAAEFAQLFSRIGKRLRLTKPGRADVDALADAWNITDREARDLLFAIATKPGALRICTKTLRLASVLAGDGRVGAAHVRDAYMDLGVEA